MRRKRRGGRGATKKIVKESEPEIANVESTSADTDTSDKIDDEVQPPPTITSLQVQVQDQSQSNAEADDKNEDPGPEEAVNINNAAENTMDMDKSKPGSSDVCNLSDMQSSSPKFVDTGSDADFIPPPALKTMHGLWGDWCRFSKEWERYQLYEKMDEDLQDFLQPILENSITVFETIFIENRDLQKEIDSLNLYLKEFKRIYDSSGKNQAKYYMKLNQEHKTEIEQLKAKLREVAEMYNLIFLKYQKECLDNKKLEFQLTQIKEEYEKKVKSLEFELEIMKKKKVDKQRKGNMSPQKSIVEKKIDQVLKATTTTTRNNVEKSIFDESFDDEDGSFVEVVEKATNVGGIKKGESPKKKKKTMEVDLSDLESEFKKVPTLEHKDKKVPAKPVESPLKIDNKKVSTRSVESPLKTDKNKNKKVPAKPVESPLKIDNKKVSTRSVESPLKTDKNKNKKVPAKPVESPLKIDNKKVSTRSVESPLKTDKNKNKKVPAKPVESPLKIDNKKVSTRSVESPPKTDKNKNKKVPTKSVESPIKILETKKVTANDADGEIELDNLDTNNKVIFDDSIFASPQKTTIKSLFSTDDEQSDDFTNKISKKKKVEIKNKVVPSPSPSASSTSSSIYKNKLRQKHSTLTLALSESETDNELNKSELSPLKVSSTPQAEPLTPDNTLKNDIYLSRKARRDQIINELPQHIKRKEDSFRSISNQIVISSTSTANTFSSSSTSTFNLPKKSQPVPVAEVKKSRHYGDIDVDKQEIISAGIKRIRTQAKKVQIQSKKNKLDEDSVDESIEQVIKDTRIFVADPDAGLYENKLKIIRVSHHTHTEGIKDKDEKNKVKSTISTSAVSSISSFDKSESGLGYENTTTVKDSVSKKLKLNNDSKISHEPEGAAEDEFENENEDEDISELVIMEDSTSCGQNDSDFRNKEEPTEMEIENDGNNAELQPVPVLLKSDKNEDLEQGEISDSDNSDTIEIESPAEPEPEPTYPQVNLNPQPTTITTTETEPGKKWTTVSAGRSGVGQMFKRCQFMIDKFMELSIDEIKKNSDEILNVIKKNGVLPSKVHLAKCINDYILSHGHENLAEFKEDELPLSITYGKILSMIDVLREKWIYQYLDLPSLVIEHFATQLVPNCRKWDDEHLVNYGRLYGAICRKYFDTERGINLLFQFLYWSPPHTFAFAFGFLCSRPEIFALLLLLSIRGKAVVFALIKPPLFFTAKYFHNIRSFFTQSINFILPDMVFDQMVAIVLDALKESEHDTTIREGGRTLAMLFMQCDWEMFLKFIQENLTDVIKSWKVNAVSDAVLAAFIRMIGDVCNDRIEFKDLDNPLQTIEAFTKLDAKLRTPILAEAIDTSISKIKAKKRLMDEKGVKEISWEYKTIPKKKKGKNVNVPKRASLKKRKRQKQKRAKKYQEKAKAEIGIRKRKKEMLKAAEELLAQEQVKIQVKTTRGKVEKPSTSSKGIIDSNSNEQSASQIVVKKTNKKSPLKVDEKLEPVKTSQQNKDLLKTRGKTRASASGVADGPKAVSKVKLPDTSRNRLLKKVTKVLPASHPVKVHYRNKKAKLAQK